MSEVVQLRCPSCGSPHVSYDSVKGAYYCESCNSFFSSSDDVSLKGLFEEASRLRNAMNFEEALEGNKPMVESSSRPKERDTFYADYERMDFDDLVKKYFSLSGKAKAIAWLRENAPKSIVVLIRSISQYITYKRNGSKSL